MIKDDGTWHEAMRAEALKDPEIKAKYEEFKLEFKLAEELKTLRLQRNFSQQIVAERMHSSKSAVSRLESVIDKKHSPSLATLRKYAEAIGCHLEIKVIPNSWNKKRASA